VDDQRFSRSAIRRAQPVSAMSSSIISLGLRQSSDFRGRPFSLSSASSRSARLYTLRSVPLGKNWCSKPLVFFFDGRCQHKELFQSLTETQVLYDRYRQEYNRFRPHGSLGYLTPEEFKDLGVCDQRLVLARSSNRKGWYAKGFWAPRHTQRLPRSTSSWFRLREKVDQFLGTSHRHLGKCVVGVVN